MIYFWIIRMGRFMKILMPTLDYILMSHHAYKSPKQGSIRYTTFFVLAAAVLGCRNADSQRS